MARHALVFTQMSTSIILAYKTDTNISHWDCHGNIKSGVFSMFVSVNSIQTQWRSFPSFRIHGGMNRIIQVILFLAYHRQVRNPFCWKINFQKMIFHHVTILSLIKWSRKLAVFLFYHPVTADLILFYAKQKYRVGKREIILVNSCKKIYRKN